VSSGEADDIPASRSPYTVLQLEHSALITIDVQADVLDGQPLEIPGSSDALPALCRLASAFREHRHPIVHLARLYLSDGSNVDLCRREAVINGWPALAPGSAGAELAAGLAPEDHAGLDATLLLRGEPQRLGEREVVLYKPRWGAFYETPLYALLEEQGVNTLVFGGFNFPNCPRTSMYEASERDFRIALATDAISGLYERGREELERIGVALMSTDQLIGELATSAAAVGS
jgi:nicotinamidase-related amidase